ncbi:MAG: DEAD/DEAH box helicase [Bdellovibrionota bacterium]
MTYTLRPYQQEAVDATLSHFRRSRDPAVIVLPTGAGKSLVIAELARIARGRVLVLTHVKELVEQNHEKYCSYELEAGIYSAGLNRKDSAEKVIFGGIQSVARAEPSFFEDFSLLVIDECHRISQEDDTQYAQVIKSVLENNPSLCVLGLTATPYRLDSGWVYQYHCSGVLRSESPLFFKKCLYELPLRQMIDQGFLTPPVQIDAPVASYDFSELRPDSSTNRFALKEIEAVLKDQRRITPIIIKNILEVSEDRRGVILFTASIRHAKEILDILPPQNSAMIIGDTPSEEREAIINQFKAQKIKYLVNVSVLTTGFDAPHVDLIAILRPTESVSLYQQIVGRGLRLYAGKEDCLILDYTGVPHDIFTPEIDDRKPLAEAIPVKVGCPNCKCENDFWGLENQAGEVIEHFGRKCKGAIENPDNGEIVPCGFRYRFKNCDRCGAENDIAARNCNTCFHALVDDDTKLKEARGQRDAHVMRPDTMQLSKKIDAKGLERLEVRYYDLDGQHLSEVFFFESNEASKIFYYSFQRMHHRTPGKELVIETIEQAIANQDHFRMPLFVIARKQGKFWRVREKIFY